MTSDAPPERTRRGRAGVPVIGGGWLRLAAAPTFALMAWLTAADAAHNPICAQGAGPLAIGGMAWMYLLMSLFHIPPWLALTARRTERPACTDPASPVDGD